MARRMQFGLRPTMVAVALIGLFLAFERFLLKSAFVLTASRGEMNHSEAYVEFGAINVVMASIFWRLTYSIQGRRDSRNDRIEME